MLLKCSEMNQIANPDPRISEIIRLSQQILHNIELFKIYLHLAMGLAKFKSIRQECPEMFEAIVRNLEETAILEQQCFDLCNSIPGFVERFTAWRAQR